MKSKNGIKNPTKFYEYLNSNHDFHIHTILSDGLYSTSQILEQIIENNNNLDVIAITDHDFTDGYYQAKEYIENNNLEIKLIPGTEISCKKYHILGLGIDIENQILQQYLNTIRTSIEERSKKRCKLLRELGFDISYENVKCMHPKSFRISKFHIANYLFQTRDKYNNSELLKTDYNNSKFMTVPQIIKEYLAKDKMNPMDEKFEDPKKSIELIHEAGGYAILAHPSKDIELFDEIDELISFGLDGIEYQPNFGKNDLPFVEYGLKKGLFFTKGSDYHGHFDRNLLKYN
jgi:predicted metal-dependent phosphoesterase TrpH